MTWHLKDREFEKVFEAYSGGNFVKALNYAIEQEYIDSECIVYVEFGREFLGDDNAENCLCFRTDELEDILDYNPKDWNNYPEVTPPYEVMMRVDFENFSMGFKAFYKHFEDGDCWCYPDGLLMPKAYSDDVKRFRPWED